MTPINQLATIIISIIVLAMIIGALDFITTAIAWVLRLIIGKPTRNQKSTRKQKSRQIQALVRDLENL